MLRMDYTRVYSIECGHLIIFITHGQLTSERDWVHIDVCVQSGFFIVGSMCWFRSFTSWSSRTRWNTKARLSASALVRPLTSQSDATTCTRTRLKNSRPTTVCEISPLPQVLKAVWQDAALPSCFVTCHGDECIRMGPDPQWEGVL